MRVSRQSIMLVKYHTNKTVWAEYRVSKGRNVLALMAYFRSVDTFRFATIFDYSNKVRGRETFYFDKSNYKNSGV